MEGKNILPSTNYLIYRIMLNRTYEVEVINFERNQYKKHPESMIL